MSKVITTFSDIVEIMSYVFETVPWTIVPYSGKEHKRVPKNRDAIQYLKERFESRKIGGWCGLNCEFFKRIMIEHGFEVASFNYGIEGILTHITIVVKIEDTPFLFDPYFNRYYEVNNLPVSFEKLMELVQSGETSCIKSVYGNHKKPIEQSDGKWAFMTGPQLETNILTDGRQDSLVEALMERFGSTDLFGLMRILLQVHETNDFVTRIYRSIHG